MQHYSAAVMLASDKQLRRNYWKSEMEISYYSNSASADQLQFQGTSTGISTFQAGAQGLTNLNYTLPIAAPAANSLLYSSGGAVNNLSWSNTDTSGQILTITGGVP